MTRLHRLDPGVLDARGDGVAEVRALLAARRSKHLLLLRAVLDRAPARLESGFAALEAVERARPDVVAAITGHPHVGAWAALCLRRLQGTAATDGPPLWMDLSHLGAIAAAAALRAGVDVDVEVPVHAGRVVLPTVGRFTVSGFTVGGGPAEVGLAVRDGRVSVNGGPAVAVGEAPGWEAVRHARVEVDGLTLDLDVDDLNPYRDCHGLGAADRLDPDVYTSWRARLAEAWHVLVTRHRPRAEAIAAGITTLVPLSTGAAARSATSADAVGAVALTEPTTGLELAVTLVHELRHSTLAALLDLLPLVQPDVGRVSYSPWRDDPRPPPGLLHGIYAFFGVADFWRTETGALADFEFARLVFQLDPARHELLASGRLTAAGRRLVESIGTAVERWRAEPLPAEAAEAARLAEDLAVDHRAGWRLRNLAPDPDRVDALAAAWRAGRPAPPTHELPMALRNGRLAPVSDARIRIARRWYSDRAATPGATAGDRHLVRAEYVAAETAFLAEVDADPDRDAPWAGLAVAAHRCGPAVLARRPELVRALHRRCGLASPLLLAGWLDGDGTRPETANFP